MWEAALDKPHYLGFSERDKGKREVNLGVGGKERAGRDGIHSWAILSWEKPAQATGLGFPGLLGPQSDKAAGQPSAVILLPKPVCVSLLSNFMGRVYR